MTHFKRRKIGDQHYRILMNGKPVAEVCKTGTHLDFYPWDWMLLDGVEPGNLRMKEGYPPKRGTSRGTTDTLNHAVNEIASNLGWYSPDNYEPPS